MATAIIIGRVKIHMLRSTNLKTRMTAASVSNVVMFLLLFSAIGAAQSKTPGDIDGWTKAKWGMSEQEVILAFAPDVTSPPLLGLNDVTVNKLHFDVRFLLDTASNKLTGVRLTNIDKEISASTFWALEKAMIEQYGMPTHRSNGVKLITAWEFPRSTIEIHYGESPLIGHYLLLNFGKASKQGEDTYR